MIRVGGCWLGGQGEQAALRSSEHGGRLSTAVPRSLLSTSVPQVYSSSVTPQVKRQCLTTLAKMLLFSSPATLAALLEDQPASSLVAALLNARDATVVAFGMQVGCTWSFFWDGRMQGWQGTGGGCACGMMQRSATPCHSKESRVKPCPPSANLPARLPPPLVPRRWRRP